MHQKLVLLWIGPRDKDLLGKGCRNQHRWCHCKCRGDRRYTHYVHHSLCSPSDILNKIKGRKMINSYIVKCEPETLPAHSLQDSGSMVLRQITHLSCASYVMSRRLDGGPFSLFPTNLPANSGLRFCRS